jgi:hypothetical protein
MKVPVKILTGALRDVVTNFVVAQSLVALASSCF